MAKTPDQIARETWAEVVGQQAVNVTELTVQVRVLKEQKAALEAELAALKAAQNEASK